MAVDQSNNLYIPNRPLKPVKELPKEYRFDNQLDVREWQIILVVNLIGVALLFVFGWLFWLFAGIVREELRAQGFSSFFSGINLAWLFLGAILLLIVHELIHGFMFWLFTRERPRFGFAIFYAYAAAPDWYIPRDQFILTGIAPFALISAVGLLLLSVVPGFMLGEIHILVTLNAAASVGDLIVVVLLLLRPRTLMVNDEGPKLTFYSQLEEDVALMSRRWLNLVLPLGVEEDVARRVFADMVDHYNAPGRYYHNLAHVGMVFDTTDKLSHLAQDYKTVEIAVWFHDVIYDPRANDNEKQSAAYARQALTDMGLAPEKINRVSDLILATISHQAQDNDIDAQIMLDADLAPLAYDEPVFLEQSEAVRKEFSYIPDDQYKKNRVVILNKFLARERIYLTEQLYSELEDKARANLQTSINLLSG